MKIRLYMYALIFLLLSQILNGQSLQRYELPCSNSVQELSLLYAKLQVGVREKTGRNDGKEVEAYLASVGLKKGNPYCQAGQYWCFERASKCFGDKNPLPKTGATSVAWNYAAKEGTKTTIAPVKGDLIYWRKPNSWQGHVERIKEILKAGWVKTIGFNTSKGREGDGVYERKRNYKHFLGRLVVRGFVGFSNER